MLSVAQCMWCVVMCMSIVACRVVDVVYLKCVGCCHMCVVWSGYCGMLVAVCCALHGCMMDAP